MATYTSGELAVQERAGLAGPAGNALRGIRGEVPEVAAAFLGEQPMIVVGAADGAGRMWATVLASEPGFLAVPDPSVVTIGARPLPGDALAEVLAGEAKVGTIAIEPATRRRMRLNGRSAPAGTGAGLGSGSGPGPGPGSGSGLGLRVELDQVISNCPKYLQRRTYDIVPTTAGRAAGWRGEALTMAQQLVIATADTFFIATADESGDADASHRGGNPGFVEVVSPTRLRWPDYVGNAMFLTLGNLEQNPAAGLVFPDWETGDLLQVTGSARTVWGAQRMVEFEVREVNEISGALPLRWSEPEFSRFNPPIGAA
ncbi:pyridoxamine 5'-phosphate oxidase family protein [Streptomyces boninensis]|uniref:pyridoxamine 5'-phosphate oxidase family protein n=1 Tax=Streptomyces boninensis TaxID=2039455 RepID=UPI003B212337